VVDPREPCARPICGHVKALHTSASGPCRLNGCRCESFRYVAPAVAAAEPEDPDPQFDRFEFVAGLVVGSLLSGIVAFAAVVSGILK